MIGTKEASQMLGVSQARVRELLNAGTLKGTRVGRAWAIDEQSVRYRLANAPAAGRPTAQETERSQKAAALAADEAQAHRLYKECEALLAGRYDAAFLQAAATDSERRFYTAVADFFLQERQRQLIESGVF